MLTPHGGIFHPIRTLDTPLSAAARIPMFEQAFKNIDDVLWKDAGCTSELDYTEQSSWLLFLKYLDSLEHDKAAEAALEGRKYKSVIGFGEAYFIEGADEKKKALNILMKKYTGRDSCAYADDALDKVCVMGVRIEKMSGKCSG
jgi:hypothetical protein